MDARVNAAIDLMRQLLADELSIRNLARNVNLSSMRLRQLFREEAGFVTG